MPNLAPMFLTALAQLDIPNPGPAAIPGLGDLVGTLVSWLKWGLLVAAFISLLIRGGQIMLGMRNRNAMATDGLLGTVYVAAGLGLASAAFFIVDAFS